MIHTGPMESKTAPETLMLDWEQFMWERSEELDQLHAKCLPGFKRLATNQRKAWVEDSVRAVEKLIRVYRSAQTRALDANQLQAYCRPITDGVRYRHWISVVKVFPEALGFLLHGQALNGNTLSMMLGQMQYQTQVTAHDGTTIDTVSLVAHYHEYIDQAIAAVAVELMCTPGAQWSEVVHRASDYTAAQVALLFRQHVKEADALAVELCAANVITCTLYAATDLKIVSTNEKEVEMTKPVSDYVAIRQGVLYAQARQIVLQNPEHNLALATMGSYLQAQIAQYDHANMAYLAGCARGELPYSEIIRGLNLIRQRVKSEVVRNNKKLKNRFMGTDLAAGMRSVGQVTQEDIKRCHDAVAPAVNQIFKMMSTEMAAQTQLTETLVHSLVDHAMSSVLSALVSVAADAPVGTYAAVLEIVYGHLAEMIDQGYKLTIPTLPVVKYVTFAQPIIAQEPIMKKPTRVSADQSHTGDNGLSEDMNTRMAARRRIYDDLAASSETHSTGYARHLNTESDSTTGVSVGDFCECMKAAKSNVTRYLNVSAGMFVTAEEFNVMLAGLSDQLREDICGVFNNDTTNPQDLLINSTIEQFMDECEAMRFAHNDSLSTTQTTKETTMNTNAQEQASINAAAEAEAVAATAAAAEAADMYGTTAAPVKQANFIVRAYRAVKAFTAKAAANKAVRIVVAVVLVAAIAVLAVFNMDKIIQVGTVAVTKVAGAFSKVVSYVSAAASKLFGRAAEASAVVTEVAEVAVETAAAAA